MYLQDLQARLQRAGFQSTSVDISVSSSQTTSIRSDRPPGGAAAYPQLRIEPARQIRLVEILPGQGNEKIQCQLHVRTLLPDDERSSGSSREEYDALSYACGSDEDPQTIQVDEMSAFPVRRNLHAVLKRLRARSSRRKIWIDQLSINQDDSSGEKNFQVPLMGLIYGKASEVIVWLGDAPDEVEGKTEGLRQREQLKYALKNTEPRCK
jgi:hypothetical protein